LRNIALWTGAYPRFKQWGRIEERGAKGAEVWGKGVSFSPEERAGERSLF